MAASRYSQVVDLENWNSSHSMAVLSVPPGSRVLDLGAADGSVARALKQRGCTVWGIEMDEGAAAAASHVCDRIFVTNLEAQDAFDVIGDETFDVVLALDVLEHLRDPALVLKRATRHLTTTGIAIVSIPNVTHGALRLSLLEGRFTYTEQGLLDRTHLRFFDRRAAERLMSEAGLTISQHLRVRRELEETEIAVNKDGMSTELLEGLARDPDATTYQFVFVASRQNQLPESQPGGMLSERLLAENEALLAQFRRLETYAKHLEADRAAQMDEFARLQALHVRATAESLQVERERDELRQELVRRTEEAHQMHRDLKHSKADVALKEAFITDLRQQLLAMQPVMVERDQLRAERDQLSDGNKRLLAKRKQLMTRRDELIEERGRLLARQQDLEQALDALETYVRSAGFRLVEGMIRRLRHFPFAFKVARSTARKIVRR